MVLSHTPLPRPLASGRGCGARPALTGGEGSRPGSCLLGSLGCGALEPPQATLLLALLSPLGPGTSQGLWSVMSWMERELVVGPLADVPGHKDICVTRGWQPGEPRRLCLVRATLRAGGPQPRPLNEDIFPPRRGPGRAHSLRLPGSGPSWLPAAHLTPGNRHLLSHVEALCSPCELGGRGGPPEPPSSPPAG